MKIAIGSITDIGLNREHNEDNLILCEDLKSNLWNSGTGKPVSVGDLGAVLFVADGMGGENAGEVAAEIAKQTIQEEFKKSKFKPGQSERKVLSTVLMKAHQNILTCQKSEVDLKGMGTTAIVAWIKQGKVFFCWSGDSRGYIIHESKPAYPATDDHSLVWKMVLNEKINADEARYLPESNIILQCLGDPAHAPIPEFREYLLREGDTVLLCSDGLNGMLSDETIKSICLEKSGISERLGKLVHSANAAGGHDNITAILADVLTIPDNIFRNPLSTSEQNHTNRKKNKSGSGKTKTALLFLFILSVSVFWFIFTNGNAKRDLPENIILEKIGSKIEPTKMERKDAIDQSEEFPFPEDSIKNVNKGSIHPKKKE